MCHANNENRKGQIMEGKELPNQERIRMVGGKENYKFLGMLEVDTLRQGEMKEKIRKEYLKWMRKNQALQQESHQRDGHLGSPP